MFMLAAGIITVGQLVSGSVTLIVKSGETKIGTAQVSYRITNKGTKFNQSKVEIRSGEAKVSIVQESEYKPDGTPIRNFLRSVVTAGEKTKSETVSMIFQNGAANISIERDGKTETSRLSPPKGSEIRRKDEFWFLTSKPSAGQTFICRQFDPNTLAWAQLTSKYVGVEKITVGSTTVKVHHIKTNRYDYWVDEKGAPIMLKTDNFTMVRS